MSKPKINATDLNRNVRDAVVSVFGAIYLSTRPPGSEEADFEISRRGNSTAIYVQGNGFISRKSFCRKKNKDKVIIITPAKHVLIPGTLLSGLVRLPFVIGPDEPVPDDIPNSLTAVSEIFVTVYNVNNSGCDYFYRARLLGVDGSGNIAFLTIDPCDEFNKCLPKIEKQHPRLALSKDCPKPGEKVYYFGDTVTAFRPPDEESTPGFNPINNCLAGAIASKPVMVKTTVKEARYIDFFGQTNNDMVLLDNGNELSFKIGQVTVRLVYEKVKDKEGKTIKDKDGKCSYCFKRPEVISMRTMHSYNAGVSARQINAVYHEFVCDSPSRITEVVDTNGNFYRLVKPTLGFAWNLNTGLDFVRNRVYSGTAVAFDPILEDDTFADFQLNTGIVDCDSTFKGEVVGLKVTAIAGDTTTRAIFPETIRIINSFVGEDYELDLSGFVSPFIDGTGTSIEVGDIVVGMSVNDCHCKGKCDCKRVHFKENIFGIGINKIAPGLKLLEAKVGQTVRIAFLKASENFQYKRVIEVELTQLPNIYDFPWGDVAQPYFFDRIYCSLLIDQSFETTPNLGPNASTPL